MIPLVAVALVAAMLTGPPLPDDDEPDLFGQNWPLYERICDHIAALEIPYLSRNPAGFAEHCPRLIAPFWLRAEPQYRYRDSLHILFVAACESGFDPLAGDRRWGRGGPQGLIAFGPQYHWPERIWGPVVAANFDPYDTGWAANLYAVMVYDGVNVNFEFGEVNWYWSWSCARSYGFQFEKLYPGAAPESRYCPPPAYWKNVPNGSNFVCGGKTYNNG